MTWRPIETAHKDAESVLIATGGGLVGEAWFSPVDGGWCWQSQDLVLGTVTHWMPLPAPPSLTAGREAVSPNDPYKLGKEWCPVCKHDDGAHDASCRYATPSTLTAGKRETP